MSPVKLLAAMNRKRVAGFDARSRAEASEVTPSGCQLTALSMENSHRPLVVSAAITAMPRSAADRDR